MRKERTSMLFGGLAGFVAVAFVQLLTVDEKQLDLPQSIAIYCFSVTLPLAIFYFISAQTHLEIEKTKVPTWYEWGAIVTIMLGFIGITALFYHFSSILAAIFFIMSFVAASISNRLDENKQTYFSLEPRDVIQSKNEKPTISKGIEIPELKPEKVVSARAKTKSKSSRRKAT